MGVIAAIGTGVTAIAASAGITITATALTVGFETVAAVGAVLSVVGTVTKNKTLSMVGLGLGLVGGVGALASSAGLLGAGGGLFADAASTPAAADVAASGTINSLAGGGEAVGSAAELIDVPPAPPGMVGTTNAAGELVTSANAAAATDGSLAMAGNAASGDLVTANATAASVPAATDTSAVIANTEPAVTNPTATTGDMIEPPPRPPGDLGALDPTTGKTITSSVDQVTGKIVSLPDNSSSGMFANILKFADAHPVATLGALQAGGSLLSGLTSSVTPAQAAALNAQAAQNQAAADLVNQQRVNLAAPKATASLTPVTGTPGPIIPQTAANANSLINAAPRLAPITGTV